MEYIFRPLGGMYSPVLTQRWVYIGTGTQCSVSSGLASNPHDSHHSRLWDISRSESLPGLSQIPWDLSYPRYVQPIWASWEYAHIPCTWDVVVIFIFFYTPINNVFTITSRNSKLTGAYDPYVKGQTLSPTVQVFVQIRAYIG